MIAADVATLLPDDFLVKVDRASMAHGLEVRPPLLDHELLELAARIPSRLEGPRRRDQVDLQAGLSPDVCRRRSSDRPEAGLRDPDRRLAPRPAAPDVRVGGPRSGPAVGDLIDQAVARGFIIPTWPDGPARGTCSGALLVLARVGQSATSAGTAGSFPATAR